jgi:heme/copper-type cytochrome/quinol oxidase subunit 2
MDLRRQPWLLILALAALVVAFAPAPGLGAAPAERTIRIDAGNFAYSPAVLDVNPGDRVSLELVSHDVAHGLYLDDYGVSVTADPGQPGRVTFVADRAGTFRFRCSVTCGALHPFMIGKLNVGSNWLFARALGLAGVAVLAVILWRAR